MKLPQLSTGRAIFTIVVLICLTISTRSLSLQQPTIPREPLSEFPLVLGDYNGQDIEIGERELAQLAPTEVLMRSYTNHEGKVVTLYLPFFETQNDKSRIHSPKSCMVGGGFEFVKMQPYHLKYQGKDEIVNWVLTRKGNDKQVVLYWIQGRGRILTNEYLDKLYLMWDAVKRHRSDGALARCIAPVMHGETVNDATHRLEGFAQMVLEEAPKFLPE